MNKRLICVTLILGLLLGVFSGCSNPPKNKPDEFQSYTSYREIPGVTEDEISAIEALREQFDYFDFGMIPSTEMFYDLHKGEINGYSVFLCAWLSELFGIEFRPALYEWGELLAGLETGKISFSGELTATEERRRDYYMTNPIAMRSVKYFQLEGSPSLADIEKLRPVRYIFLGGSTTIADVTSMSRAEHETILVYDYESAYAKLKSGEGDVFFAEHNVEAAFDQYADVVADDYLPLIYSPVSLATQNPELTPIISVVDKILQTDEVHHLTELYKLGYSEYLKHKMYMRLSEEERDYIAKHPVISFAAEYENYPMSFYNTQENAWQGIVFDVLKEINKLTDITFELANPPDTEWPAILDMLDNREVSMVSELIRTPEREGHYLWPSTVLLANNYTLISKADRPNITINEVL